MDNNKNSSSSNATSNINDTFRICNKITPLKDEPLKISFTPSTNDIVFSEKNEPITLVKELSKGGEGVIYETNKNDFVAKIYFKKNNTAHKFQKIKLMTSKNIKYKGICFPSTLLYNKSREFVGYLMPKASGRELGKTLFIKKLFLKYFPNWTKRETIILCLNILDKIKFLHSKNVILGDINPANILIVSPKEIYFVDTDSYQIENFPCPVGTINFTAPEIQGKKFGEFLRTKEHENFALATLLFMIMLPGKLPYSQIGGEDQASNIINGNFSYPLGEDTNKKAPEGPWRFMWSHLLFKLKEAFYNTFKMGGSHFEKRLDADEWIKLFLSYAKAFKSLLKNDEMALEIYPTRYKKIKGVDYKPCKLCGNEDRVDKMKQNLCYKCLLKTQTPALVLTCKGCSTKFTISHGEYKFYTNKKGFNLPKRCPKCRGSNQYVRRNLDLSSFFKFFS